MRITAMAWSNCVPKRLGATTSKLSRDLSLENHPILRNNPIFQGRELFHKVLITAVTDSKQDEEVCSGCSDNENNVI